MIAVAAIVILIIALVVLTIFGSSLGGVQTIGEATNQCIIEGKGACGTGLGSLPPTWSQPTKKLTDGTFRSCAFLTSATTCTQLPL